MGYPVPAYRTSEARGTASGFQGLRPRTIGDVLRFPQGVSDAAGRRQRSRERKNERKGKERVPHRKTYPPRNPRKPRVAPRVPKPSQPFGYAGRLALRRKALGGLSRGLKLRGAVLRAIARWAWESGGRDFAARLLRPHPMPGWTLHGTAPRWGNPYYSGATNAHTTGSTVRHNEVPGSGPGGDNWDGPPFDWAEYDSLTEIINPITGADFYDFLQVGRGDQGTGPDPRILARWWRPVRNASHAPGANPYAPAYNPYWQGHGRPSLPSPRKKPRPRTRPMPMPDTPPMADPDSAPINRPQDTPSPMPRHLLPRRQPNPWRSPTYQTNWGPSPVSKPKVRDKDDFKTFPWPDSVIGNKPVPLPRTPPVVKPPVVPTTVTEHRPGQPPIVRREPNRRDRPPQRKEKERKYKAPKWVMRVLNGVTEFSDLVRALYKALPDKYKKPNALIIDQWAAVYAHLAEINLNHAIRAILRNQVEDYLYGNIGRLGAKGAHRRGDIIDKIGRSGRKFTGEDYDWRYNPYDPRNASDGQIDRAIRMRDNRGVDFAGDPIDAILDQIFGEDT